MGAYCHHSLDHVHRHVVAVFAIGRNIRLHSFATAILANPFPHAALLRDPDTTRQNVANAPIVALKIAESRSSSETPCAHRHVQKVNGNASKTSRLADSCALVIFGGNGVLSLFNFHIDKSLPEKMAIIAVDRADIDECGFA